MKKFNEVFNTDNITTLLIDMKTIKPFSEISDNDISILSTKIFTECNEKFLSTFCENVTYNGITENTMPIIANYISLTKKLQWEKLWNVTVLQYDPLYNVDAHEIVTRTPNIIEINTDTYNKNTEYQKGTEISSTQNQTKDSENTTFFYGDNSDISVPSNKNATNSGTFNNNTKNTGSDNDKETGTIKHEYERKGEEKEETRRYGNIGVTSSQNLINQEIDFWKMFDFYNIIICDIVNILTNSLFAEV